MMEAILSASKEFQPCGFFTSAREALAAVPSLEVQIVVVEVALPDLCGIRCARELMARRPGLMAVNLGAPGDPNLVEHALAAGVHHYLVKPVLPWQYMATLQCVWALRHAQAAARVPRGASASPYTAVTPPWRCPVEGRLTEREQQIMACLADGCVYKAIERELQLSEATVKRLQHRAYQKLQADNRTTAIEHWRHWGGR